MFSSESDRLTKVYIDQDGVLADFRAGLWKLQIPDNTSYMTRPRELWTEAEVANDKLIQKAMAVPGFFRRLPPIPDYKDLWALAGKDRYVLTAHPNNAKTAKRVAREKKAWCDFWLGNVPAYRFICCLRSEKKKYATTREESNKKHSLVEPEGIWGKHMITYNLNFKPCVLVDDLEKNCEEWEEAGGIAILFRNMSQACRDLKRLNVTN